jgi:tetratricopeptide (TPR) repeat protein
LNALAQSPARPQVITVRPANSSALKSRKGDRWRDTSYTNTEFGRALMWTGRYEEAINQFHKAIALDPTRNRPYTLLGRALALQGKYTEAMGVLEENARRGTPVDEQAGQVCVQMRLGRQADALALLERGLSTRRSRRNAEIYGCLGDKPHTLEYLERALSEHESGLAEILQSPELAWTRRDPDFAPLRKKLNLSQ